MAKVSIAKQVEDNKSTSFDKQKALALALSNIEKKYGILKPTLIYKESLC